MSAGTSTPTSSKKRGRDSPHDKTIAKKKVDEKVGDMSMDEKIKEMSMGTLLQKLLAEIDGLLDKKLQDVARKDDLRDLRENISKISEESEVTKGKVEALEKRLDELENRSRRNNLIVRGIDLPKERNINYNRVVADFLQDIMGVRDVNVNRAHPIGRPDSKLLIAHIPADRDLEAIFQKASVLRDTNFYISRDFSQRIRGIRRKLLVVRKKLKLAGTQEKLTLVYDHLYAGNLRIDWDGKLKCGKNEGIERLAEAFPALDWRKVEEELAEM